MWDCASVVILWYVLKGAFATDRSGCLLLWSWPWCLHGFEPHLFSISSHVVLLLQRFILDRVAGLHHLLYCIRQTQRKVASKGLSSWKGPSSCSTFIQPAADHWQGLLTGQAAFSLQKSLLFKTGTVWNWDFDKTESSWPLDQESTKPEDYVLHTYRDFFLHRPELMLGANSTTVTQRQMFCLCIPRVCLPDQAQLRRICSRHGVPAYIEVKRFEKAEPFARWLCHAAEQY